MNVNRKSPQTDKNPPLLFQHTHLMDGDTSLTLHPASSCCCSFLISATPECVSSCQQVGAFGSPQKTLSFYAQPLPPLLSNGQIRMPGHGSYCTWYLLEMDETNSASSHFGEVVPMLSLSCFSFMFLCICIRKIEILSGILRNASVNIRLHKR